MTSSADTSPAQAGPGAPTTQIAARASYSAGDASRVQARSFLQSSLRRFAADRLSMVALVLFVLILAVTLLAPAIATYVLGTTPDQFLRTPEGRIATLQPPGPG